MRTQASRGQNKFISIRLSKQEWKAVRFENSVIFSGISQQTSNLSQGYPTHLLVAQLNNCTIEFLSWPPVVKFPKSSRFWKIKKSRKVFLLVFFVFLTKWLCCFLYGSMFHPPVKFWPSPTVTVCGNLDQSYVWEQTVLHLNWLRASPLCFGRLLLGGEYKGYRAKVKGLIFELWDIESCSAKAGISFGRHVNEGISSNGSMCMIADYFSLHVLISLLDWLVGSSINFEIITLPYETNTPLKWFEN